MDQKVQYEAQSDSENERSENEDSATDTHMPRENPTQNLPTINLLLENQEDKSKAKESPLQKVPQKLSARNSPSSFPTSKSPAKKRRQVDFLDISKEDFSKYETLDLEGKPAKPSKHNIFRDSLIGDKE